MRNPYLCLMIVFVISSAFLFGLLGLIVLAYNGREIPPAMIAIVASTFGSLASFLVYPPKGSSGAGTGGV